MTVDVPAVGDRETHHRAPDRPAGHSSTLGPVVVIAVAVALTLLWVGAVVVMSGRSIDVTDESFYLLSYRWWSSNTRTFTGAQYVYGPVFGLLGHSVVGLRLFALATVLLAHAFLGWTYLSWLGTVLRGGLDRVRRVAGTTVVVAAGGVGYGWMPHSPSYNDIALLSSMVLAALVLATFTRVRLGGRVPLWPASACGPFVVALVLAKWSSAAVTLLFVAVLAYAGLRSLGARGTWRAVGVAVVSVAASLAVLQLAVMPLSDIAGPMLEVNRLVAARTNSLTTLLGRYSLTSAYLVAGTAILLVSTALVSGAGLALSRTRLRRFGLVLVVLGPYTALLAVNADTFGIPGGGIGHVQGYTAALMAMASVVLLVAVVYRRSLVGVTDTTARGVRRAVVVLLVLLPVVQALGTGNPIYLLAVNQLGCWAALMVGVVLPAGAAGLVGARAVTATATLCAIAVAAFAGADGVASYPTRSTSHDQSTRAVGGTGPIAPLLTSPAWGAYFDRVREAAGPGPSGRPVIALDEVPGLALLLDGRPVGEAWTSRHDHQRSDLGIRAACAGRPSLMGERPVVLMTRAPEAADLSALATCGLALPSSYVTVTGPRPLRTVRVYRPVPSEGAQP